jgi:hypothetical protein
VIRERERKEFLRKKKEKKKKKEKERRNKYSEIVNEEEKPEDDMHGNVDDDVNKAKLSDGGTLRLCRGKVKNLNPKTQIGKRIRWRKKERKEGRNETKLTRERESHSRPRSKSLRDKY